MTANFRNLDQLQEGPKGRGGSFWGALLLAGLGIGALVVTATLAGKSTSKGTKAKTDPLAELVRSQRKDELAPEKVKQEDVTFPGLLSDGEKPTTALAAIKDERGRLVALGDAGVPTPAPMGSQLEHLSAAPLSVGALLNATQVTTQPKDSLSTLAAEAASAQEGGAELAPAGSDGGVQIQVASFKQKEDAEQLVAQLRKRGHSAFRQAAYVPERGLWHRVRIGPFKSKYKAELYKKKFEKSERFSPFVVDPHKQRQAEEIRAAKLAARLKKYGRP